MLGSMDTSYLCSWKDKHKTQIQRDIEEFGGYIEKKLNILPILEE